MVTFSVSLALLARLCLLKISQIVMTIHIRSYGSCAAIIESSSVKHKRLRVEKTMAIDLDPKANRKKY